MSKPKVVFLDFDGVLTSARVHAAHGDGAPWKTFDPVTLNFFKRQMNVEFVISSTWRLHFDFRGITHIFGSTGWDIPLHQIWCTPHPSKVGITDRNKDYGSRAREIMAWIDEHLGDRDFVVVDDAVGPWPDHWKVVQTDPTEGMLWQHYDTFNALLRKGRNFTTNVR